MKLTKKETDAFAVIGAALCAAKGAAKLKKQALPDVQGALDANAAAFAEGVVIGKYRFQTTTRVELGAIEL